MTHASWKSIPPLPDQPALEPIKNPRLLARIAAVTNHDQAIMNLLIIFGDDFDSWPDCEPGLEDCKMVCGGCKPQTPRKQSGFDGLIYRAD
jgi:hypothetical protein